MAKENNPKNTPVFIDVITSIAVDAANGVEGIHLLDSSKSKKSCNVYFLENDKVTLDLYVNVDAGFIIPNVVADLQDKIKTAIENTTKFIVSSINVQIMTVLIND